jgi:hypothetical protein
MNAMTTKRRDILIAMGAALVLGIGAAGALALGNNHPAMTAAHPTPLPTATITAPPLPRATITKYLPQATKTIIKKVPSAIITCGKVEDDCYPDYIGQGRWVMRQGERPMPKATKKVPQATTYAVCSNSRITKAMVADCNHLAMRPKVIDAQGNETPNGRALVAECIDSYDNATELAICLAPPSN